MSDSWRGGGSLKRTILFFTMCQALTQRGGKEKRAGGEGRKRRVGRGVLGGQEGKSEEGKSGS